MRNSGGPDFLEVHRFMGQQKVAKKLPRDKALTRAFLLSGLMLIIIGILWMQAQGTW